MKKLLFIILILFSLSSCTVYYHIGESQQEFIKANYGKGLTIESMDAYHTTYRCCNNSYNSWFLYFENGVLVRVDNGEIVPDVIIQSR